MKRSFPPHFGARSLHKSWQDKRPRFSRRVRWYEVTTSIGVSIRLQFSDAVYFARNEFFTDRAAAQAAYDAFINRNQEVTQ